MQNLRQYGPQAHPAESVVASGSTRIDAAAIFEEYFHVVWRSLQRLGVPKSQVDDATQDVFLAVQTAAGRFEGRSELSTWIHGIVINTARNYRRRASAARQRHEADPPELVSSSPNPERVARAQQAAELLFTLLEQMDDNYREVFVCVELEQMAVTKFAESAAINLNTAYTRLRVARDTFDALLRRHQNLGEHK
ncbi:MAG: hypothetical protein RJA70_4699 [Pseudomonadota bacterium]